MTRFYTGPQPPVISEWSETLNDAAVEEFASFAGFVIDFDTVSGKGLRFKIIRGLPQLVKANKNTNKGEVGQCLDYIFFSLYYFFSNCFNCYMHAYHLSNEREFSSLYENIF